jgi:hypothetical protein
VSTVLVGGGPAAAGLLAAAVRTGALDALLDDGLTLIAAGSPEQFGGGRLGGYLVRSDTRAAVFAETVAPVIGPGPAADGLLDGWGQDEPVPLAVAAEVLAGAGRRLLSRLRAHPGAVVRSATQVAAVGIGSDDVIVRVAGQPPIRASRVIFAVGGHPHMPPRRPAGQRLLLHSDQVLRQDGYQRVLARLTGVPPRVTIIGGSHSAFAVAGLLLRAPLRWAPGAITVAHRSPVRVTYSDRAAAGADGVLVDADQVCPATGVVHRFGGLRADAADLYRRVRDGGERRVRLIPVPATAAWPGDWPGDADVVVAATGYESAAFGLLGGTAGSWDAAGRLRTATDGLVPRAFGLGLGTQRRRGPGTGGEPAFRGGIDGVWFYQNVVGPELLSLVLSAA